MAGERKQEHSGPLGMFQRFFQSGAAGSVVLLLCTVAALVLANSRWAEAYSRISETKIGLAWGDRRLGLTIQHFVNDFLMAIFFFVVGLEIKRELVVGQLSSARKAALPAMAAVGGMIVPALVYAVWNAGGPGRHGWGIPMATDIAFALGLLALFGDRV